MGDISAWQKSFAFGIQRRHTQTGRELFQFTTPSLLYMDGWSRPALLLNIVAKSKLWKVGAGALLVRKAASGPQHLQSVSAASLFVCITILCATGFDVCMLYMESASQASASLGGTGYCQHVPLFQASAFGLLHSLGGCSPLLLLSEG